MIFVHPSIVIDVAKGGFTVKYNTRYGDGREVVTDQDHLFRALKEFLDSYEEFERERKQEPQLTNNDQ
jgi:hypothetical protein